MADTSKTTDTSDLTDIQDDSQDFEKRQAKEQANAEQVKKDKEAKLKQEQEQIKNKQAKQSKNNQQVKEDYNKVINMVNKVVEDKKKNDIESKADPKLQEEANKQAKLLEEEKQYIEDKCEKYNTYAVGLGKTYPTRHGMVVYNYDLYKCVEKIAKENDYNVFKRKWIILDGQFWKWRKHGFNYYKLFVDSFQTVFRDYEYRTWNHLIYLLCHLSKQPDSVFQDEYKNTNMDNYLDVVRENLGNQAYNNIDRYYKDKNQAIINADYNARIHPHIYKPGEHLHIGAEGAYITYD